MVEMKRGVKILWDTRVICTNSKGKSSQYTLITPHTAIELTIEGSSG